MSDDLPIGKAPRDEVTEQPRRPGDLGGDRSATPANKLKKQPGQRPEDPKKGSDHGE